MGCAYFHKVQEVDFEEDITDVEDVLFINGDESHLHNSRMLNKPKKAPGWPFEEQNNLL